VQKYTQVYNQGLDGIRNIDLNSARQNLKDAKALAKNTDEEKEFRKFEIEFARKMISAKKAYDKYYGTIVDFVEPDMTVLTSFFNKEDEIDQQIFELNELQSLASKENDKDKAKSLKLQIKSLQKEKKAVQKDSKAIMDEFAKFNRAAKPYNDAKKLLTQKENFSHFDEIAELYDDAKLAAEEEDRIKEEQAQLKLAQEQAEIERRKAEKLAKKNK
jgi:hypothetical protein